MFGLSCRASRRNKYHRHCSHYHFIPICCRKLLLWCNAFATLSVILSAAKDLDAQRVKSFAALRITSRRSGGHGAADNGNEQNRRNIMKPTEGRYIGTYW